MQWEHRLAEADEALAELGKTDEEVDAVCRRAANGALDLAEVDARLEELADGPLDLAPLPSFDLDAIAPDVPAAVQDNWDDDAATAYAAIATDDGQAYADLIEESGVEAAPNTDWDDINEEATMAADIIETEDGEFVLMVDEEDIELVGDDPDDSGVEPVKGKEAEASASAEAKSGDEKEDKSFLRRLFSRS